MRAVRGDRTRGEGGWGGGRGGAPPFSRLSAPLGRSIPLAPATPLGAVPLLLGVRVSPSPLPIINRARRNFDALIQKKGGLERETLIDAPPRQPRRPFPWRCVRGLGGVFQRSVDIQGMWRVAGRRRGLLSACYFLSFDERLLAAADGTTTARMTARARAAQRRRLPSTKRAVALPSPRIQHSYEYYPRFTHHPDAFITASRAPKERHEAKARRKLSLSPLSHTPPTPASPPSLPWPSANRPAPLRSP